MSSAARCATAHRPPAHDWDLTTNARPEPIQELFPGAINENSSGRSRSGATASNTRSRPSGRDHEYADHRRPHHVEFGDSLEEDLARRDFTVNAMAWGAEAEGLADCDAGRDRRPVRRRGRRRGPNASRRRRSRHAIQEDALRMIRPSGSQHRSTSRSSPATLAAIYAPGALAKHLSGERIATELERAAPGRPRLPWACG